MIAGRPTNTVPVPGIVLALARGRPTQAVWLNQRGGVTFEIGGGDERTFVKWAPASSGLDLEAEVARLRWAAAFTRVPRVLGHGSDRLGTWVATEALAGDNAVDARWKAHPAGAVRAIGEGLRALHDALPVKTCPFSWALEGRVADVERRAADNLLAPERWNAEHRHLSVAGALDLLHDAPPVDRLVVCHGDACAPNTLIAADGRWSGHVDLGALGVADRWADLAVACWSTTWNYGPNWSETLLDAYGVSPDPRRMAYYRLLWDLGP